MPDTTVKPLAILGVLLLSVIGGCAAASDVESPAPGSTSDALELQASAPLPACPSAPASDTKFADEAYGASPAQKLDVYVPNGPGPYPLVVFIHGGGWSGGDKSTPGLVRRVAERGYVLASLNYRLSGEAKFPAQIHDVKAAVRWLRGNSARFKIDPTRVAASGGSAGGHLAALLGTSANVAEMEDLSMGYPRRSSAVQAVVEFAGPTDFSQMDTNPSPLCDTPKDHSVETAGVSKLLGCLIQECPDKVQAANPIRYVTADDPPFLTMHGNADCTVPIHQSQLLVRALRGVDVPASLAVVDREGHLGPDFTLESNMAKVDRFLDARLKGCQ